MGDQNDCCAAPRDLPGGGEEAFRLVVGQHRRRLVKDQYLRAGDQHLDNFDPLLFGNRQAVDASVGVDGEAQRIRMAANLAFDLAQPRGKAASLVGEEDVLGNGKRFHQLKVLMHHADAMGGGVARSRKTNRRAVDQHVTGVGRIKTCGHVHQRGFAGAVLPEQGMDFTAHGGEVRVVQRQKAVERFAYLTQLQRRGHHRLFLLVVAPSKMPNDLAAPIRLTSE